MRKKRLNYQLTFSEIGKIIKDGVIILTRYEGYRIRIALKGHPNDLKAQAAVKSALGIR